VTAYDAVSQILDQAGSLGAWLGIWEARRQDGPDAHARRCAADAMGAIDAMLAELHALRSRLVSEIRAADDAAAARADTLLGRLRGDQR
jgi:hypothetical protein